MTASSVGHSPPRAARPRVAPAILLATLLTACAPATDTTASRVLEEVLASHRASIAGLDAPAPARTPVPRARARGGGPGTVAALLGQSREGVLATLGQPTRRRPEGDAEIWLYQSPNCALDVVLYRDGGTPRVAWAAARASGTQRRTEAGCLSELGAG